MIIDSTGTAAGGVLPGHRPSVLLICHKSAVSKQTFIHFKDTATLDGLMIRFGLFGCLCVDCFVQTLSLWESSWLQVCL